MALLNLMLRRTTIGTANPIRCQYAESFHMDNTPWVVSDAMHAHDIMVVKQLHMSTWPINT